jgi:hypothetical protein
VTTGSATDLLVLHAVRLAGMADDHRVATRYGLDPALTTELLLDHQAYGWVSRVDFAGTGGWTLTDTGRRRNEQQLAAELAAVGAAAEVALVHRDFLPSNARLLRASTDWQLKPSAHDPLTANRHDDPDWDARVIEELSGIAVELAELESRLVTKLRRFAGYHGRFAAALTRVHDGDVSGVTEVGGDSCHTVWMELHEDLLATLGLERGTS